jgi:hypothetical protein
MAVDKLTPSLVVVEVKKKGGDKGEKEVKERRGISVTLKGLLRKRQNNEQYIYKQYIHKMFVKHHLNPFFLLPVKFPPQVCLSLRFHISGYLQ